jgi:starvation-inducible DNA-binding protein
MLATEPRLAPVRQTTTDLLQATLVELIDLSIQAKQAHWTVRGPHFRAIHLHLDELVTQLRDWYDEVAERQAALDLPPDGRTTTVAASSAFEALPAGWLADEQVVATFAARLATLAERLGERIETLGETDPISQDLLIGIAEGVEKQRWMFAAQVASR